MFIVNKSKTNYLPAWGRLVESPSLEFQTGNMLRKMSGLFCFVCLCAYPSGLVYCGLFVVPVVIVSDFNFHVCQ